MKKWMLTSSLLILFLVGSVWGLSNRLIPSIGSWYTLQAAEPVTYELKKADFRVEVPAFGELEAAAATPISVPNVRTGGLKVFFIIKDGSLVKKGDTLVEFDASELLQQMEETENSLEAMLRQLEASVLRQNVDTGGAVTDLSIAEMERVKAQTQAPKDIEIFTRNQIIEGELNIGLTSTKVTEYTGKIETKKNIGSTQERILVIERSRHSTKRDQLQQSLGSLKILAPHGGLVILNKDEIGRSTNIGETRWPGYTLMTIPETSVIKARVQVLESDAGGLQVGQPAAVRVDSHPETVFEATVERIDTLARARDKDSPVKYLDVILKVQGAGGEILKPGKLVRAEITTTQYAGALVVPRIAMVEESAKYYLWIDRPLGPEKREVEIATGDTARVVIRSGAKAGEFVLLNPPQRTGAGKGGKAAAPSASGRPGVAK